MRPLALSLAALLAAGAAQAQTTITCLAIASHLERQHAPLVEMFNERQDEIEVVYAAPAQDYSDVHLRTLRASATDTLPDCVFSAYNQLPPMAEALDARGQITDLGPLMKAEGEGWVEENYTERMLRPGQVDGTQWSIPFNASLIQWYYNADLFREAGLDPDAFPDTWDGIIEAALAIDAVGEETLGLSYGADHWGDDWPWQTLITTQGGRMVSEDRSEILFDEGDLHVAAMRILRDLVESGAYDPTIDADAQLSAFTEGDMGLFASSPAGARFFSERVGGAFDLRSAPFTIIDDAEGYLPVGGNVAAITTTDPERVAAAWEYVKFVTGPEAQAFAADITGYLPTNRRALGPDFMGSFYEDNPYYATPRDQYHRVGPYAGYKGTQTEKIWRDQRATIREVMLGELPVEEGAARMAEIADELMER